MLLKNYYYWFKSALTPEFCEKVIELGTSRLKEIEESGGSTNAVTFGSTEKQSRPNAMSQEDKSLFELGATENDVYVRDSNIAWLNEDWIYNTVVPFVHEANKKAGWNWDVNSAEHFQFTKYTKDQFYGWHKDGQSDSFGIYRRYIHGVTPKPINENGTLPSHYTKDEALVGKVRKISMTISLSTPEDYDGGDLKFDFGVHSDRQQRFHTCEEIRPRGSVIVFPSFVDHCVTPVTRGTRYSLVLWSLGAPWK